MNAKPSGSTASEVLAELATNTDYLRRQQEREAARLEHTAILIKASQPVINDLKRAGIELKNFGSQFGSRDDEVRALPILRQHLDRDYPNEVLQAIVQKLGIRQALPYRNDFITLFRDLSADLQLRYALGFAIAATTTRQNLSEAIELLRDRSLGAGGWFCCLQFESCANAQT